MAPFTSVILALFKTGGYNYDAILIDTSIFDANGLRLDKGILGKLTQFSKSPITYLFPDVIKYEVQSHLEKKIKDVKTSLNKALNNANDYLTFGGLALNDAKQQLVENNDTKELAKSKIDKFIADTGALVINCGEFVSVEPLLQHYFSNQPPFAETGKKKNEFPDAIVLLAVEAWAEKEGKKVLSIAADKDWKEYCDKSKNIDYLKDFSSGLMAFNRTNAPYALLANLDIAFNNNTAISFLTEIESHLTATLEDFTPDQDAESSFYWEPEGCRGWFREFSLFDNEFRIIDTDEDWIVLAVYADIKVEVEGEFSLSVYDSIDRDQVPMGSITVTREEDFDSEILITISGDLNGDVNELSVDEVEILNIISTVNFGNIEPDFGDEY